MKLKRNGSHHGCDDCIHKPYCSKTESGLINYARKHGAKKIIWIPNNCQIWKEKVEFT
jgi:predicted xylose isomerase-like sugar epimerase